MEDSAQIFSVYWFLYTDYIFTNLNYFKSLNVIHLVVLQKIFALGFTLLIEIVVVIFFLVHHHYVVTYQNGMLFPELILQEIH
jgi:hypothetical protein